MTDPNIDEIEKKVDEVLHNKTANNTLEVVGELQVLANDQDENIRIRAVELLSTLATKSNISESELDLSRIMEDAYQAHKENRLEEAVKYYEQALKIDSSYLRAKENLQRVKSQLKLKNISSESLPAEAAIAYSKAQSNARVGRYKEALKLIKKAHALVEITELGTWKDGIEFHKHIEQQIIIEEEFEKVVKAAETQDLRIAFDLLRKYEEEFSSSEIYSSNRKNYIEKVKEGYEKWESINRGLLILQESPIEVSSYIGYGVMRESEELHQQFPYNSQLKTLLENVRAVVANFQKFTDLVGYAKTEMGAASYKKALAILEDAKLVMPIKTDQIQGLIRIAQTNLAKQEKYDELMRSGTKHFDAEDYETAMAAFQEAENLIYRNSLPELPNTEEPQNLLEEGN
jgi:hypothetical protein